MGVVVMAAKTRTDSRQPATAKAVALQEIHTMEARLVDIMTIRHLQRSFPSGRIREQIARGSDLNQFVRSNLTHSLRVIAVVGAGGSAEAFGRAPELVSAIAAADPDGRTFDAECSRLSTIFTKDRDSLEVVLAAATRSPSRDRDVRRMVSRFFALAAPSLQQYEAVAHLTKHRCIDAVISYNFDQILDQSLLEELNEGEFHTVVTDRDASLVPSWEADHEDYIPLYVKPHGTASDPDSLRFTLDQYYDLPEGLLGGMATLIGNEWTAIISIGCGMTSFDQQYLLAQPDMLEIFDLSPDKISLKKVEEFREAYAQGLGASKVKHWHIPVKRVYESRYRLGDPLDPNPAGGPSGPSAPFGTEGRGHGAPPHDEDPPGAEPAGVHLLDIIHMMESSCASSVVETRSVARHEVITGPWILHRRPGHESSIERYLRDRAILEFVLAALKSGGVTNAASLVQDRSNVYYERLRACGSSLQWDDLLGLAGLVRSRDSNETYLMTPTFLTAEAQQRWDLHQTEIAVSGNAPSQMLPKDINFKAVAVHLLDRLQPGSAMDALVDLTGSKPLVIGSDEGAGMIDELAKLLKLVVGGSETEIGFTSDETLGRGFTNPTKIPTHTALRFHTEDIVDELVRTASSSAARHAERDYKHTGDRTLRLDISSTSAHYLRVPDAGSFSISPIFKRLGQVIDHTAQLDAYHPWKVDVRLLVSFVQNVDDLHRQCLERGLTLEVKCVDWWRHSRFMFIGFCEGRPVGATYYLRRLRRFSVTPMLLKPGDAEVAHRHFERHWEKGIEEERWKDPDSDS